MVRSSLASSSPASSRRHRRPAGSHRPVQQQLPVWRAELERQRDFRNEQLAHLMALDGHRMSPAGQGAPAMGGDAAAGAHREIHAKVAAGARHALADIERALARMNEGTYGRCRACGDDISLAVLTAIPATTVCQACRRQAAAAP